MLPELLKEMGFETASEAHGRPLVGVSACLLGHPVRHDGGHRDDHRVRRELGGLVHFTEVCPEVAIGLPVPRPPIQVVALDDGHWVRGVSRPRDDYTDALTAQARRMNEPLNGFVFKARSPSCGLGTTPIHDQHGHALGLGDGAYAASLTERFPRIPVCNESDLEDPLFLNAFVVRLFCHHRWLHSADCARALDGLRRRADRLEAPLLANIRCFLKHLAADHTASHQQRGDHDGNHAEQ